MQGWSLVRQERLHEKRLYRVDRLLSSFLPANLSRKERREMAQSILLFVSSLAKVRSASTGLLLTNGRAPLQSAHHLIPTFFGSRPSLARRTCSTP